MKFERKSDIIGHMTENEDIPNMRQETPNRQPFDDAIFVGPTVDTKVHKWDAATVAAKPEEEQFKPSFLAKDEDELKAIQDIPHRGISRTLSGLHKNDPEIYTTDSLRGIYYDIEKTLNNEDKKELDDQTSVPMARLTAEIKRRDKEEKTRLQESQKAQVKAVEDAIKKSQDALKQEQDAEKKRQDDQKKLEEQRRKDQEAEKLKYVNRFKQLQEQIRQPRTPANQADWDQAVSNRSAMVGYLLRDQVTRDALAVQIRTIIRGGSGYEDANTQLLNNITNVQDRIPVTRDALVQQDPEGMALREVIGVGMYGAGLLIEDVVQKQDAEKGRARTQNLSEGQRRIEERARHGFLVDVLGIDLSKEVEEAKIRIAQENREKANREKAEQDRRRQEQEDLAKRMEQALKGEGQTPLPDTEPEQEKLLMPILESIELQDTFIAPVAGAASSAFADVDALKILNSYMSQEKCSEALRKRIFARLCLQHSASVVRTARKSGKDNVVVLSAGFSNAEAQKYALEGEQLGVLFQQTPNIPIAEAFNLLQEACTRGLDNGALVVDTLDEDTKAEVTAYIETKMGSGATVRKALQLAWRIADATMESDVWNRKLVPGDILSEAIYFREFRTDKENKGRTDQGPRATIPMIESLATSFMRSAKLNSQTQVMARDAQGRQIIDDQGRPISLGSYDNYLVFNQRDANINAIRLERTASYDDTFRAIQIRNKGYDYISRDYVILDVQNAHFAEISRGSYLDWVTRVVRQQLTAKELFLKSDYKPQDLFTDKIDGYKSTLGTIDGGAAYHIREIHVYGALSAVFGNMRAALDNGWGPDSLQGVATALTLPTTPDKPETAYLSPQELNNIKYRLKQEGYQDLLLRDPFVWFGAKISQLAHRVKQFRTT
jgi:hypothetical protein